MKKMIREICKDQDIDLDGTIDDAINMLQKYKEKGWTDIDTGWYGDQRYNYFSKYRLETDHEYDLRINAEKSSKEQSKEQRRQYYEQLKKEFGDN